MMYKAKAAVCPEIRMKHSTQSEHYVEFWMLSLVVRKQTARLWKVNITGRVALAHSTNCWKKRDAIKYIL